MLTISKFWTSIPRFLSASEAGSQTASLPSCESVSEWAPSFNGEMLMMFVIKNERPFVGGAKKQGCVPKKQKQGIIGIYLCVYVYLYMCHTTHIHMLFHNNSSRNKNNKNIESKTTTVRVRAKRKKEKLSQHKISWSDEKEDRINEILCACVLLHLCLDVCQSSSRSVTQTHTRTSSVANMRKNCQKASKWFP